MPGDPAIPDVPGDPVIPPGPQDPEDPEPTETMTCNPSIPTEMVVFVAEGVSEPAYQSLLGSIPKDGFIEDTVYVNIDFRIILVEIDRCDALKLIREPSVYDIKINVAMEADMGPDTGPSLKKESTQPQSPTNRKAESPVMFNQTSFNNTQLHRVNKRDIGVGKELVLQYPAPTQLKWLSSAWGKRNRGTSMSVLDHPGFLYDRVPRQSVVIFVVDTGLTNLVNEVSLNQSNPITTTMAHDLT